MRTIRFNGKAREELKKINGLNTEVARRQVIPRSKILLHLQAEQIADDFVPEYHYRLAMKQDFIFVCRANRSTKSLVVVGVEKIREEQSYLAHQIRHGLDYANGRAKKKILGRKSRRHYHKQSRQKNRIEAARMMRRANSMLKGAL